MCQQIMAECGQRASWWTREPDEHHRRDEHTRYEEDNGSAHFAMRGLGLKDGIVATIKGDSLSLDRCNVYRSGASTGIRRMHRLVS